MKRFLVLTILFLSQLVMAQNSGFDGFNYQSVIYDSNGSPYVNTNLQLKVEIRKGVAQQLMYDEVQNVTSSSKGYVSFVVGIGIPQSGGLYPLFNNMVWTSDEYNFMLYLYNTGSMTYSLIANKQINSNVFSLYSKTTAQKYSLGELTDVDTLNIQNGQVLKWNGIKFVAANDSLVSDTVQYSNASGQSNYCDTAVFALNAQNIIPSDTAIFSFNSGYALNSTNATNAIYSDTSSYATHALVADSTANAWLLRGNLGTNPLVNFVGTKDANDLYFKTNDTTRITIKSNGRVGIGTSNPSTDLHITGNGGVIFNGTFGSGTIPVTGAGMRLMWYPKKAAFRGGILDAGTPSTYWDDAKIGNYSICYGRNVEALGLAAVSMGEDNHAQANYSAAFGNGNNILASGLYSFAAGTGNTISSQSSAALGRGNVCTGVASGAFGYHSESNGAYSRAFGFYTYANAAYSTSMGYQCRAQHQGSFIYNDYSDIFGYLNTTAANQFMVKAAGGTIFYSNSTSSSGVSLAAGSGSWSTLSDSLMKENFVKVDGHEILNKLSKLNVYYWNYKTQSPNILHIGPTAQEFYRAFQLGESNRMISSVDADGVNLAAIKALNEKIELLSKTASELESANEIIDKLLKEREGFVNRLNELEALLQSYSKKD